MTESEVDPDPEEAVAGPVDDGDETDDSGTGDIGEDVSAEFDPYAGGDDEDDPADWDVGDDGDVALDGEESESDLDFLFDEEFAVDEEKDEGSGGFRPKALLIAVLLLLLAMAGIAGWLIFSEEEHPPEVQEKPLAFTHSLPPELLEETVLADGQTALPSQSSSPSEISSPEMPGDGMAMGVPASQTPDPASAAGNMGVLPLPEDGQTPLPGQFVGLPPIPTIKPPGNILSPEYLEKDRLSLSTISVPELIELTENGPLPIVSPDGRSAWQEYARPFDEADLRPRIAIVIRDLGMSSSATETAIQQLPGQVTLAFSPYARNLEHWIALSRAAGHEVMLTLPMEPLNYPINDPGPYALIIGLDSAQNVERLDWLLSRVSGYVGVTNTMGARFTANEDALMPIMAAFKKRGLLFLDSRSTKRSVAIKVADEIGLPRVINDRVIDSVASRAAIDKKLNEAEILARETGFAVVTGSPYPVTFERIAEWLPRLDREGFVVAPVSALVNKQAIK
ncbi:MAG: divergent polysaccharide deacetylase family protein [Rhodospirillaceae bacterium]|nr:divergent polysaccharide deacetylase family protein [Rhodospirillaceae bacterium]MBT5660401.1 divergent polysaccharide deacetylase family protein [Rhodospirillaceae bacterium]MBT5752083.1 divergent polysaccharide deacetylase family protein [Rhodospirillaceae bacterium]